MFNDVFNDVSYVGSAMCGEILGTERRRFWLDYDKFEVVNSVGVDGASVKQVAQRQEIKRQQVCTWRHDLKKKGLWSPVGGALFYPMDIPVQVSVPAPQLPVLEVPPPTAVELRLRDGRCLHFDSTMNPVALTRLIRAVDAV